MTQQNLASSAAIQRCVTFLTNTYSLSDQEATYLLKHANHNLSCAIVMHHYKLSDQQAQQELASHHGDINKIHLNRYCSNSQIHAVFFDMDSTLVNYHLPSGSSTWAALGWAYSIYPLMQHWWREYKSGHRSYGSIWHHCADILKNKSIQPAIEHLFPRQGQPPLLAGFSQAIDLIRNNRATGIISSGISIVANRITQQYHLDFQVSNHFHVDHDVFTGQVDINIPLDQKLTTFERQCAQLKLNPNNVCYVGDGTNDLAIFEVVGLPVLFRSNDPTLRAACNGRVIHNYYQLLPLLSCHQG